MIEKKTRPRGRPPLPPAEKKRRNFTFRGTDELHDHLATAAIESGRSISEEIEWRLGQSFFTRDVVRWAVEATLKETFAYVDQQRGKEEAERERSRSFSDLLKPSRGKK